MSIGDKNGRSGNSEVADVTRKLSVEGVNEIGEHWVEICAQKELFLANTFFQCKMIHRYTWRKDERCEQKTMINLHSSGRETGKECFECQSSDRGV